MKRCFQTYTFSEHPVGPTLVDQYYRGEYQRHNRHDPQRIRARRRVVDRQAPLRVKTRNHHPREELQKDGCDREQNRQHHHHESPTGSLSMDEVSRNQQRQTRPYWDWAWVDTQSGNEICADYRGDNKGQHQHDRRNPQLPRDLLRTGLKIVGCLQAQENRPIKGETA